MLATPPSPNNNVVVLQRADERTLQVAPEERARAKVSANPDEFQNLPAPNCRLLNGASWLRRWASQPAGRHEKGTRNSHRTEARAL